MQKVERGSQNQVVVRKVVQKAKESGKAADGLGTCTYVKARHILCEKQGKINEAYKKLQDGWLSNGVEIRSLQLSSQ
nr:peptidyl-prolyl cis-trans isomerase NIMA-interacting 4 [Tanacetum cinerariifolium]